MNKRTPAQIEASRRNGAKSKGPITEEGKARASINALKHGLNSRVILLQNESPEEFERLHNRMFEEFHPTHPTEITLCEDLVLSTWRLQRIIALETAAMDYETETQRTTLGAAVSGYDQATQTHLAVAALIDRSRVLTWYSRHEGRLRRAVRDARAQLQAFRTPPPAAVPHPQPQPEPTEEVQERTQAPTPQRRIAAIPRVAAILVACILSLFAPYPSPERTPAVRIRTDPSPPAPAFLEVFPWRYDCTIG